MEDFNFRNNNEIIVNYRREKKSLIKTLLRLTSNSKSKKNISLAKKEIRPYSDHDYNKKITKVSSARDIKHTYYEFNNNTQNNKMISDNYFNEDNNHSNNKIIFKNKNDTQKYAKNNKNITINYIYNNNYYYIRKKNDSIKN